MDSSNIEARRVSQGISSASYDEAEHWLVRMLDADCSLMAKAEFEHWLAADSEHVAAFEKVNALWQQSKEAVKDPAIMSAALRALQQDTHRSTAQRWFIPAAFLGFVVLLGVLLLPRWLAKPIDSTDLTYTTSAGQQQTITLSDGSSLILDTDTKLVVRYNAERRRVDLLRGQAQFTVRGNRAWPFVVHANSGTVTAIGTQFQVRLYDRSTNVSLLKGTLAIATEPFHGVPQHAAMSTGQSLSFDTKGRITPTRNIDMQSTKAWTQGKLFVHDWSLSDLLTEMNRYNNVKLEIGDPSLKTIRISGVFRTHDQETLIMLLKQSWPIRTRVKNSRHIELLHY